MRQYSAITEESQEMLSWDRKLEEMEIINSLYGQDDNYTMIVEPSATETGSFSLRIEPNCGTETVGCSIEMQMTYQDVESMDLMYEINFDSA